MRKTKTVTMPGAYADVQGRRDDGKTFLITEMSSRQAEHWADRAFLCLAHSSVNLPPGMERSGMAGIAEIARLLGNIQFPELSPLMDELLTCVQIIPDPGKPFVRPLVDNGTEGDDIEEAATRQLLRSEVMDLHVNFSLAAVILNLIAAASEMRELPISENTSTSRRRSARSSRAA
jgi:hypothetical protein